MLLSLRHTHRELHLGVREARRLAQDAVQWLRCGVPVGELRRRLTEELPKEGVRCAVGFLRYRLVEKAPGPPAFGPPPSLSASEAAALTRERSVLVTCEGPGAEHVFRPLNGETCCAPCRQEAAWQQPAPPPPAAADVSWRERVVTAAARG
ncbi:hypothetical protein ABCR94_01330 [Streptomyces sp. 21So2-11]|uniref:hypothetical protein n=1 Tax=Streptomyces sp. 21So2-11 TaxID=3144408 RepID=UPI00321C38CA